MAATRKATYVNNGITSLVDEPKGEAYGIASLGADGKVPSAQLPSYVDDVLEFANLAAFPVFGESGIIYVAISPAPSQGYRWSGSTYSQIGSSLALGETSLTAYRGDRGKTAYDHSQAGGNPHETTAAQVGAEPSLGNPGVGTWFLRAVAGVRSWIQLGALALKNSISNADVADAADIAWTKISKSGADPEDIGASAAAHNHNASDINAGILPTTRGGTGSTTLPSGFAVSVGEQLVTLPQAEKSIAFFETAHGGFNAALLSDEFEVYGPPTGPTVGLAEVAWPKVNKTGAVATDVGALPATAVSGAINFDSINSGLPCAWSLAGASYTNGPPGASSTTGYFLIQGVGRDGLRTQYVTDTKFGGAYHRFQTSSASGAWSAWFAILDSAREGVDIQAGSWTLNTSTKKMVRQTSAGTLTLPTASAAYAGFRTTITSNFSGNITIAGVYEYLDPNSTPSYWYNTLTNTVFAVNNASSSGNRVTFDIWCDGVYWYVRF